MKISVFNMPQEKQEKLLGKHWGGSDSTTAIREGFMNKSIPKEISPEYSLEGLMLKLKV